MPFTATHGMTRSPEYRAWRDMKYRCTSPHHPAWHHYGGRGIQVCPDWMDSFALFFEAMGPKPFGYQLDRRDCDLGYDILNCRWVDSRTNTQNTHVSRRWHIRGAIYLSSRDAAASLGVVHTTIMNWCRRLDMPDCWSVLLYETPEPDPEDRFDYDVSN